MLDRARHLAATAQDEAARQAYLRIIAQDPTCCDALVEFAALVRRGGHRSAAASLCRQAIQCSPNDPRGHVELGTLLCAEHDHAAARGHFDAALVLAPGLPQAHQGLARCLAALGDQDAAERHRRIGFRDHAVVRRPYRGTGPAIPLLLLVSAQDGNIPTTALIDDTVFAVTALVCDHINRARRLPPHAVVLNAIGDADLCGRALAGAASLLQDGRGPVINPPHAVARTGRIATARRLGDIPDVTAPAMAQRRGHDARGLRFPVLLRAPGFHAGQHFVRVERADELPDALAALPGDAWLAIEPLATRGADGLVRKYRVMCIGGRLYPLHLAISRDWKVHYASADMARDAAHRTEEARFLGDMQAVLGARAMAALARIGVALGLDYAGIDFALAADGTVLLFEANATMGIHLPDPDPIWDFRRPAISAALRAAQALLLATALGHC